jgi:transcriptional regulator with XRE-family HTH domain
MTDPVLELKRRLKSLTQAQLAKEAGLHQSWVSNVLNGLRKPPKKMLAYLGLERRVNYVRTRAKPAGTESSNGATRSRTGNGP